MRSHQEYYDGMHGLESMDDASLEHRSVKTGAGNASTAFDKNKNAKVNWTTAEKRKIEEEEGRRCVLYLSFLYFHSTLVFCFYYNKANRR